MKQAVSYIFGSARAPKVKGIVRIQKTLDGFTKIDIDIKGLEHDEYELKIHDKGICRDDVMNPYESSGDCYIKPGSTMPTIIPSMGRAKMTFYTKELDVDDILGKSMIIKRNEKNRGEKIACGIIREVIFGKKHYS